MQTLFAFVLLSSFLFLLEVDGEYQSAGCSDEGCGIPCYLRPPEDDCHYTEHDPCDGGGATALDQQLWLLNNSLVRLQEKLVQKGIIPAGNTCPPLPAIENGGVIYSDLLLSVGVVANFVCNEDFSLHGHGWYECSVDGVWIGKDSQEITKKPTCEVPIPYGHISYHIVDTTKVQPGDVAAYSCDVLYTLQGEQHRICLRNGTWSGLEPTCIAPPTTQPSQASSSAEHNSKKASITAGVVVPVAVIFIAAAFILTVIYLLRKRKRNAYKHFSGENTFDKASETAKLTVSGIDEETHKSAVATLHADRK